MRPEIQLKLRKLLSAMFAKMTHKPEVAEVKEEVVEEDWEEVVVVDGYEKAPGVGGWFPVLWDAYQIYEEDEKLKPKKLKPQTRT